MFQAPAIGHFRTFLSSARPFWSELDSLTLRRDTRLSEVDPEAGKEAKDAGEDI